MTYKYVATYSISLADISEPIKEVLSCVNDRLLSFGVREVLDVRADIFVVSLTFLKRLTPEEEGEAMRYITAQLREKLPHLSIMLTDFRPGSKLRKPSAR